MQPDASYTAGPGKQRTYKDQISDPVESVIFFQVCVQNTRRDPAESVLCLHNVFLSIFTSLLLIRIQSAWTMYTVTSDLHSHLYMG